MDDATPDRERRYALAREMLQIAVPLWIARLAARGGATGEDFARVTGYTDLLGSEDLLFASKKKGDTAKAFNALAEAIAVLAYVPGGVTLFGDHWEAPRTV